MILQKTLTIQTKGNCDMVDITPGIADVISNSSINNGTATIFVSGSTAGVTTIEYEGGLVSDFKAMWDRTVPRTIAYQHDSRWGDGNGFSHVRAALMKPSLTIPLVQGRLTLGTWQQIVFIDFDNRGRQREIIVQIMGG